MMNNNESKMLRLEQNDRLSWKCDSHRNETYLLHTVPFKHPKTLMMNIVELMKKALRFGQTTPVYPKRCLSSRTLSRPSLKSDALQDFQRSRTWASHHDLVHVAIAQLLRFCINWIHFNSIHLKLRSGVESGGVSTRLAFSKASARWVLRLVCLCVWCPTLENVRACKASSLENITQLRRLQTSTGWSSAWFRMIKW